MIYTLVSLAKVMLKTTPENNNSLRKNTELKLAFGSFEQESLDTAFNNELCILQDAKSVFCHSRNKNTFFFFFSFFFSATTRNMQEIYAVLKTHEKKKSVINGFYWLKSVFSYRCVQTAKGASQQILSTLVCTCFS